ncbi:hypothetical protein [Falsirhodobacter sp. 20TX0035]|uniref:hypothetical protein n=1 Tax=Falsirhodobacter sp. 20TX0035 TaxID=3022019 RepID=UPI00232F2F67|nr:hypothetical protein [Falsirhodobacter sp. 20TX0035]MDB6453563.1 hypothetical protein [Falsirhodobacter sp. 20TX0035]
MDGLGAILGTAGAAILGVLIAYLRGRAQGKAEVTATVRQQQAEATIQKQTEVQDAVVDSRTGSGDWRERLRASHRD